MEINLVIVVKKCKTYYDLYVELLKLSSSRGEFNITMRKAREMFLDKGGST
jgi:hypothetical protein